MELSIHVQKLTVHDKFFKSKIHFESKNYKKSISYMEAISYHDNKGIFTKSRYNMGVCYLIMDEEALAYAYLMEYVALEEDRYGAYSKKFTSNDTYRMALFHSANLLLVFGRSEEALILLYKYIKFSDNEHAIKATKDIELELGESVVGKIKTSGITEDYTFKVIDWKHYINNG